MDDDLILEQSETFYDDGSNVIETTVRQRYHNAPDSQTGPLQDPATTPKARVTYSAMWPDGIGRGQASANYGTNGGTALTRPSTIPIRSDTALVTSMEYDSAGNTWQTTDPAEMVTRFEHDAMGRLTSQVLNYVGSSSFSSSSPSSSSSGGSECERSADQNITTLTTYNADGNVSTLTALNAYTGNQTTQYVYGTTLSDSGVATSILKRKEIYPDSVDDDDVVLFAYNRQQQLKQITDQGGTEHQYDFDLLGRQTQDRVTTLGTGVDGSVRRIETTFELRGMKQHLSSYDNATVGSGAVVNDCQFVYNDFRQLVTEYQSHSGLVNTGTTPKIQYEFANGSANTVRPTTMTYPNGRVLTYSYGTTNGVDDAASRVVGLIDNDGTTHLADYSYLGQLSFVETDYTQPNVIYTLVGTAGGNDPDTGDIYRGLDRFGRIKDSYWYDYGNSTDTDRIEYGYDRVSNRIWRQNVVATTAGKQFDELYQYDQIHRLKHMYRGTLNGTQTAMTSDTLAQCWTLDETGNWKGFSEDDMGDGTWDLVQSRAANPVNEISGISETTGPSWVSPVYNRAGNMTTIPQPASLTTSFTATYDAWNRLMSLVDGANTVSEYAYDGATRRVIQNSYAAGILTENRHFYFTKPSMWQVIEERLGTSPDSSHPNRQFVSGLRYSDDYILRDRDTNDDGGLDERLYALQDANWNVVAVADSMSTIQERYAYRPYGIPLCLSSASDPQTPGFGWELLYCGYYLENGTSLYRARYRTLHSSLGCWLERDPLTYGDGPNMYSYVTNSPLSYVDPLGLITLISIPEVPEGTLPPIRPDEASARGGCRSACTTWQCKKSHFSRNGEQAFFGKPYIKKKDDVEVDVSPRTLVGIWGGRSRRDSDYRIHR